MDRARRQQPSGDAPDRAGRPAGVPANLPNRLMVHVVQGRAPAGGPMPGSAVQRSVAAVVQRATREELLDAYRDALGRSDWNEVALRLNGFNDPEITRLVAGYSAATAKAVKDAALTTMSGWNARVVGPINARLSALMGGGKVLHATAKEIKEYLVNSPFLKGYVSSRFSADNPLEGHIHVDDAATFRAACIAYIMAAGSTREKAESMEPNISAFRDRDDVHVHEGRGQFTTTIHESMHRFSDAAFQTQLGFNANEGATEYFTRIVCRDQGLSRSGFYESPLASIELLVSTTSREFVADAYFKGAMGLLKIAVDGAKEVGTFDRWKVAIKAGNHTRADALLR